MAIFKLIALYLLVSVFAFHLLPSPVLCDDKEENLLRDINAYRQILNLPVLEERDRASCLADEIADDLEDKPCDSVHDYYPVSGGNPKLPHLQENAKKCKININTTRDVVIMPVCVPDLEPRAVFSNYIKSNIYTKYLNSSRYAIAGVGSEDDWMVLILSTNTSSGDFSSANSLLAGAWKGHYLVMPFFLVALILLIS